MTIRPTTVLDQLAKRMHALNVATYLDAYDGSEEHPAVVFGDLPDRPVAAVSINHYNTDPDYFTVNSNPLMLVQLRWRADGSDPFTVQDYAHNAFQALHTYTPALWGGDVSVLWMLRTITAPPSRDDNQRWTQADSYEIRLEPGE